MLICGAMVKRILRITGLKRVFDGKTDFTDGRIGTDFSSKNKNPFQSCYP